MFVERQVVVVVEVGAVSIQDRDFAGELVEVEGFVEAERPFADYPAEEGCQVAVLMD